MHWKKKTFVLIIAFLIFFVVREWTYCQGMCWSSQRFNSNVIFWLIVIFTAIFLYYSLTLWTGYKQKYIEKKKESEKK
jgi:uncharacterized RDD family membrane protein YckC